MSLHWMTVETRLGAFHVASHDHAIITIKLPGTPIEALWQETGRLVPGSTPQAGTDAALLAAAKQLQEFAAGIRSEFSFPIRMHGTAFQKTVWNALQDVAYGETASYSDIAARIGKPQAARAVGGANRANPLPIVVPCHRIIAADGGLGGYMGQWAEGAGLGLKKRLLEMERAGPLELMA